MSDFASTPMVVAMLLCDNALNSDGKSSLIGIFDKVISSAFPAKHSGLFLFVKLADGRGEYTLKVQYVDAGQNKVLGETTFPQRMQWPEGSPTLDFRIQQAGLEIPHPGRFEFRVFLDDHFIGLAPFVAEFPPEKK